LSIKCKTQKHSRQTEINTIGTDIPENLRTTQLTENQEHPAAQTRKKLPKLRSSKTPTAGQGLLVKTTQMTENKNTLQLKIIIEVAIYFLAAKKLTAELSSAAYLTACQ